MNKKIIFLCLALALIIGLYFILNKDTVSTISANERDFNFESTDKIDKIFIKNKFTKEYVTLTKKSAREWMVNNEYVGNIYHIDILLETLRKIRVKKPVSDKQINQVIKNLALNGHKVEIYENGKLSKVFYVGNNTLDEMGTYFYMDKAKEPFICHIPGFKGFLNSRFYTNQNSWRTKNIFSAKDEEIKYIDVKWMDAPMNSFHIDNSEKTPLIFSNNQKLENNKTINLNKLKSYLKLWENLSFEGFPINLSLQQIDSISKTTPILELKLTDKKDRVTILKIHKKGIFSDTNIQTDKSGNPLAYDIENFYAFINNNNKEVVQIQDYIFGKVMKTIDDFKLK
jgi:hypothetical protein